MWHKGLRTVVLALIVAAFATGGLFAIEHMRDAGWFDSEGQTVTNYLDHPVAACTSHKSLAALQRAARQNDVVGVIALTARGFTGEGCIPIYQTSTVTYFGDPYKQDYVRAYVGGYPDKVLVPSQFIIWMLEKEAERRNAKTP